MIDTANETTTCKDCGRPIVQGPGGHRKRVYCNAACKMRDRRRQTMGKQQPTLEQQNIAILQEKLTAAAAKIEKQTDTIAKQRSRIDELSTKNRALSKTIDELATIEEAFSTDTGVHSFQKWLASHRYHAERPGCKKILDKAYGFPPAGSRGTYTEAMRKAYFGLDDKNDVWDAWRDMLRDELFKSYYANRDKNVTEKGDI